MNSSALLNALRILLLSFCFCHVTTAWGNDKERLLLAGDAAYSRKAYDSAVIYYEQAAAGKSPEAVALYKLGNAHYRLRHIGEAMLAYERALLRQPGFAAAAQNARVIQKQVEPASSKEVFFIQWWRSITAPELSNVWAILAIIIFAGLLGTIGWNYYKGRKLSWLRPQIVAGLLLIATAFVVFSLAGAWRDAPHAAAVVMRPDTKFRPTSAQAKGNAMGLPEGLLVKVLNAGKDEAIIALPDGQQGFVQRFDIAIVE